MTTGMSDPRDLFSTEIQPLLPEQEVVSEKKVDDARQRTKDAVNTIVPPLGEPPYGFAVGPGSS